MDLCGYDPADPAQPLFKLKMAFLCLYTCHNVFFVIGQLMHLFLYKFKIAFFEKYKISPDRAWPWEKDAAAWQVQLRKSLKSILRWIVVFNPLLILIDHFVMDDLQMQMTMDNWPSSLTVIKQVVFFMVMEDLLFYWSHRLLHHPRLYPHIHKRHHEFKDTVSIASEYAHPLESLLSNTLPTVAGYKLLGGKTHMATVLMWVIIRVTETIDGHSGYEFSWSPYRLMPFSGSASFHDYHHTHNIGNYGSFFTLWDTLCGTSASYWRYLNQQQVKQTIKIAHMNKKAQ